MEMFFIFTFEVKLQYDTIDFFGAEKMGRNLSQECQMNFENNTALSRGVQSLFRTHPEIIPVGQFFRRWIKSINQAWTFTSKPFGWLIDGR